MSEWKKVKLGEILQVKKGEYITKKEAKEGIYPVILGGKEPAYYIDKYNHTGKAIVISRSGASAGYVSFWNEPIFVTDGFLIEPKDDVNFEFLYYILKSKQRELHNTQKGAAIPHVTPALIGSIDGLLPDILTQQGIVSILSRYDSLIENYQKQIKLLEEAAQRLYKEWFVDLHFPGYENTKIVDGVPEGWEKTSITNVFDFKYGKILPTKDFVVDGPIPVYGASKQIGRYTKANCFEPKVLVGSRGNAGYVHRTIEKETYVTNNSFIVNPLKKYDYLKLPFIFESFRMLDFVAICTGAAQPQLTLNSIASLKYLVPAKNLIISYCDTTNSYFSKIAMAYKQIRTLTEARNRLLPKLMSGEINVE